MKFELLSVDSDAKTSKGMKRGYLTGVLYLAPAMEADGEHNMCLMATAECMAGCLWKAGRAAFMPNIIKARIRKTLWYLRDVEAFKEAFKEALRRDVARLVRMAEKLGMIPAVRVNGTSDQPKLAMAIAKEFPSVMFYDYTKLGKPWNRVRKNYHVTYSFSGENLKHSLMALARGVNVAVVFQKELPRTWNGFEVVDGDRDDLRFLDPRGVVVGLKAKGPAKRLKAGGFVQIASAA